MMKKPQTLYFSLLGLITLVSILPMLLFSQRIGITKYSIPAICLLIFHTFYGFLVFVFQHKGNFLIYNRHFLFNLNLYLLFVRDKEFTFTKEYEQAFDHMFAIYWLPLPLYLPCILLTATPTAMPIALVAFLLPQAFFIVKDIQVRTALFKTRQFQKQREEKERIAQERREEMGQWK